MTSVGGSRALGAAKRFAPYVIAILALGFVLHRTDTHKLVGALRHAPIVLFVAFSAFMLVLNCAADTFAMTSVFRWFGCRVSYRDLFLVRASTYLLAIVNYHVGQAAIIGYLYRAKKVPFLRATGWILFIIGINVGTLFLLASAGAADATGELSVLRSVPYICVGGIAFYSALLLVKPRWLLAHTLFGPLFEMGIRGHIKGVMVRLPHIGVLLLWHYVSLHMFGVNVPPGAALLYLPAYFAVGSLPINVNGLGVAQLVAIAFFSRYAQDGDASVIAYSLSTSGVSIVLQLLLGFACLRRGAALGLNPEALAADGAEAVSTAVGG